MRTALSAGVPLALAPRFGDQPLHAAAVEAAGAGLVAPAADRIGETVRTLLTEPAYAARAAAIAADVDSLPEAGEALRELERADAVVV